jgi:hypothetical protein
MRCRQLKSAGVNALHSVRSAIRPTRFRDWPGLRVGSARCRVHSRWRPLLTALVLFARPVTRDLPDVGSFGFGQFCLRQPQAGLAVRGTRQAGPRRGVLGGAPPSGSARVSRCRFDRHDHEHDTAPFSDGTRTWASRAMPASSSKCAARRAPISASVGCRSRCRSTTADADDILLSQPVKKICCHLPRRCPTTPILAAANRDSSQEHQWSTATLAFRLRYTLDVPVEDRLAEHR